MTARRLLVQGRSPQRGLASLVVVMVLFFVVSLMAAYTSRNLIFEQKTSANQARSTLAFEAADAGIEWALAQLNGSTVDDNCAVLAGGKSVQNRYLLIDHANGTIRPQLRHTGLEPERWPTCVSDGAGGWRCLCPDAGLPSPYLAAPVGQGPFPAFRVWLASREPAALNSSPWIPDATLLPRLIPAMSVGCTRLPAAPATLGDPTCLSFLPRNEIGDGTGVVHAMLALRSGLAVPPAAAITALGTVTPQSPGPLLHIENTILDSGGFTLNSGGSVADKARFDAVSVPGTPGDYSFADGDARLASLSTVALATPPPPPPAPLPPPPLTAGERMFVSTFGMKRDVYQQQPGLRICASPCSAAALQTLLADNPNRVIWAQGNVTLNADVGSTGAPLLLIIDGGNLTLGGGVKVVGFIYVTGTLTPPALWPSATVTLSGSAATIQGALVAEGDLTTTSPAGGALSVTYNRDVMDLLRTTYGSWARLPGGWRDFKAN